MQAESTPPTIPYDREAVYTALTQFDEADAEFQAGIQTIVGPMQSSGVAPEQIEETKKRAKVFFWSQKTGNQVDYADYTAWLATNASIAAPNGDGADKAHDKEPYPASFDAIVELITTGKTDQIPGIRDIPLKINEQPPTQPTMSRPLKPWEKAGTAASDDFPQAASTQTTATVDTNTSTSQPQTED
ncbi:uncharacterized protein SRS1_14667 [Sporisorium reilianum f. sp. reilianum]|uniref:Uncharacterized protein n=1 Tax=Sporisorium reilianum f. sp. reilianum TaxID=72559 RepID=A0A2N8UH26_9BASI|nr:uncharacterized protein SRS1_14667 [Sporisorium reilianum f. sp. reilianum]